jgi:gliding motility-associated-like protein
MITNVYRVFLFFSLIITSVAFGQGNQTPKKRGEIIYPTPISSTSPIMDPNRDGFVSKTNAGFSPIGPNKYWVPEFEIPMFGIPKIGGDVTGDNIGKSCGITDLIPDDSLYSVYATRLKVNGIEYLMFRFRVGDDNPSVEAWTILLDVDQRIGPASGETTFGRNPGFEIDITLIKNPGNGGVFLYNVDNTDRCPNNELIKYPFTPHFQISVADEASCGDPDYFYDIYVPFTGANGVAALFNAATGNAYNLNSSTPLRYAAVTNVSATCALGGNIADISGVDFTDYQNSTAGIVQAFIDLIENQCGTPVDDLDAENGDGFDKLKVSKPKIKTPIRQGQMSISGSTVEPNIFIRLEIFSNIQPPNPDTNFAGTWEATARYTSNPLIQSIDTSWVAPLPGPLQAYDRIVATALATADGTSCASNNNSSSSTSVTVAEPNTKPVANPASYTISEDPNPALSITLTGSDPDLNELGQQRDVITFSIVPGSGPNHGTIIGSGANWIYTPFLNYFGPDSFQFITNDGVYNSDPATISITVTPVNDAPVLAGSAAAASYTTVFSSIVIDNTITVTDVDNATMGSAVITITGNFQAGEDVLLFTNTANITGVYSNGVLTLTGTATRAQYAAALASIRYHNTSNRPNTASRTVSFVVNDGELTVQLFTLNSQPFNKIIQFNIANYPPNIEGPATATTPEDTSVSICLTVTDPENDAVEIRSLTSLTNNGTSVVFSNNPACPTSLSFTYSPTLNFNGLENVRVVVCEVGSTTQCDTITVAITVTPVNDNPELTNDAFSTAEDNAMTLNDVDNGGNSYNVLANDTDPDGDALRVTQFVVSSVVVTVPNGGSNSTTLNGVGTLTIHSNGNVEFTPVLNYNGTVPTITYTVTDGTGTSTATAVITVTPVNDAPVAVNDTYTTNEDVTLTGNVLSNDSDPDLDPITVTQFVIVGDGTTYTAGQQATIAGVGTLQINSNGSFTFIPTLNYNGTVPEVTYTISDGSLTASAKLNITVTPINDNPELTNDAFSTVEDNAMTLNDVDNGGNSYNVLANDTDPDVGDVLEVSQFVINAATFTIASGSSTNFATATITNVGVVKIYRNGDLEFTPVLNYNGTVPTITYTVTDGTGTSTATVVITVTPVNDAPLAVDDSYSVLQTETLNSNILSNDSDIDGDALVVTQFEINSSTYPVTLVTPGNVVLPGFGELTIASNGNITFVPDPTFSGNVPDITYTISDGNGGTATAVIRINVVLVLVDPIALNDAFSTAEDNAMTLNDVDNGGNSYNVLLNDTDPNGDNLEVTQFVINSATFTIASGSPTNFATATITNVGVVKIYRNGDLEFTPVLNYNGTVPTITYTVTDGTGSVTAIAVITVTPVNDAPVALDDSYTTNEDVTLTGNVLLNDSDVDGNSLSVTQFVIVGDATTYTAGQQATIAGVGTLQINGNGSFTFIPALNYNGSVPEVTYTISDGSLTASAKLNITVMPVNDNPILTNDVFSTAEDNAMTLNDVDNGGNSYNVLANDTDPDVGDVLEVTQFVINAATFTITSGSPTNFATATIMNVGVVKIYRNGDLEFTPVLNYNGTVPTITYTVTDGTGTSTATVVITVTPVNDAPVALNDTYSTLEDTQLNGNVITGNNGSGVDSDVDGDALSVTQFVIVGDVAMYTAGQQATIAGVGTLQINGNGSFTFIPALNYNGTVPEVTYTISDGSLTASAKLNITVTPVNDAPVAVNDLITTLEDVASNPFNILANDIDVDNALDITSVDLDPLTAGDQKVFTVIGKGTFTVNNSGLVVFTPVLDYNNPVSEVLASYRVKDVSGALSNIATISVIVTPVNDAPIVEGGNTQNFETQEDIQLPFCITVTDVDLDGIVIGNIVKVSGDASTLDRDLSSESGDLKCFLFTPEDDFNGISTWDIQVCDDANTPACVIVRVIITITPVNDAPVAVNDFAETDEEVPVIFNIVANDYDVDTATDPDNKVNPATVDLNPGTLTEDKSVTVTGKGTFVVNATGDVTYTPTKDFFGTASITYTVKDFGGLVSNVATITVEVENINDAPVFVSLPSSTDAAEEDLYLDPFLPLASDVENNLPITYEFIYIRGVQGVWSSSDQFAEFFKFTPEANKNGISVWKSRACDNLGACAESAEFIVPVIPVNDPPVAVDDIMEVPTRFPITINVLDNDLVADASIQEFYDLTELIPILQNEPTAKYDPFKTLIFEDNKVLTTTPVSGPTNGTATLLPDGTIQYSPNEGYAGSDLIVYEVCDTYTYYETLCTTGNLIINVLPPKLRIYEGVSPDNNGLNDYWRIDGVDFEPYDKSDVKIFDRYNNLVWETKNYRNVGNNWTGQSNHGLSRNQLTEGTYYYVISFGNGERYSGYVILKRD